MCRLIPEWLESSLGLLVLGANQFLGTPWFEKATVSKPQTFFCHTVLWNEQPPAPIESAGIRLFLCSVK